MQDRSANTDRAAAFRHGPATPFDSDLIAFLEISRDLMCICRAGRVTAINGAGLAMLGQVSPVAVIGRPLTEFIIPDYRPVIDLMLRGVSREDAPIPTRLLCHDATPLDVELQVFPTPHIAPDAVMVSCHDISREGRLANQAQEQDARIHLMVENGMNLVAHIRKGRVHYINRTGAAMLKAASTADMAGRPLSSLFHEDYADLLNEDMLAEIIAEGTATPMRLKRLDGAVVDAMVMVTRLPGQRDDLMVEARDITAHNRAVVALRATNETLERRVVERTAELERANRSINDGIQYASRIQAAMLPGRDPLAGLATEMVVGWDPLDIVGGDYYWAGGLGNKGVVAVMDCTGHGVPGAFMTAVVATSFSRVLAHDIHADPAEMLGELNRLMKSALSQDRDMVYCNDGLDAALCVIDPARATLTFAGANLPLLMERAGTFDLIRPDRMSLGYLDSPSDFPFTTRTIPYQPSDTFYLFTDGLTDQIGGPNRRLFGRTRLRDTLAQVWDQPLDWQKDHLFAELENWRNGEPRRDDMTFLAFRPS